MLKKELIGYVYGVKKEEPFLTPPSDDAVLWLTLLIKHLAILLYQAGNTSQRSHLVLSLFLQ